MKNIYSLTILLLTIYTPCVADTSDTIYVLEQEEWEELEAMTVGGSILSTYQTDIEDGVEGDNRNCTFIANAYVAAKNQNNKNYMETFLQDFHNVNCQGNIINDSAPPAPIILY